MTASAPPEPDLLPLEEVSLFRASAPTEASLSSVQDPRSPPVLSLSSQELPPSPPSPQGLPSSPPSPQEPPPSPQSVVSDIDSSRSPFILASPPASLAPINQSLSGSVSQPLALSTPPPLSQSVCASSHSQVPLQSTSLTPIETSLINNCDDIGFLLRSIPQNRIRSLPSTLTDLSYEDATSFFADDLLSSSLVPTEVWR